MARSLKSKRRKKLNAIKRERYGKKELIRLQKMLGLPTEESTGTEVKQLSEVNEIANVVNFKEVQSLQHPVEVHSVGENEMSNDEIEEIRMKRMHKIRSSYRPNARLKGFKGSRRHKRSVSETGELMEHDQRRRFNETTLRDQHGNYPTWMNQKTVMKLAQASKKLKRLEKRKKNRPKRRHGINDDNHTVTEREVAGLVEAIVGLEKCGVSSSG